MTTTDEKKELIISTVVEKPITTTDAVSIITGTAIGGGFLALPSLTTPIGYVPAVCGLVASWAFLWCGSCAFCEAAGLIEEKKQLAAEGRKDEGDMTASLATVIQYALGPRVAWMSGMGFLLQMLAIVTAQSELSNEFAKIALSRLNFIEYTKLFSPIYLLKIQLSKARS